MKDFDVLKQSPLFMLSLSSKELFHSNFIAWLWEKYPAQTLSLFSDIIDYEPKQTSKVTVSREHKNIDLMISYNDVDGETVIIIENKVKSVPNEKQLKEYQEKLCAEKKKQFKFILLSIIEPRFIGPDGWKHIDYITIIDRLRKLKFEDGYDSALVQDYCDFTAALNEICNDFLMRNTPFISDDEYALLSKYRIHDVVLKQQYNELACRTQKKFQASDYLKDLFENRVDSGFTNGKGLVDFKVMIKDDFMIGVQLQGRMLRYVAEIIYDKTKLPQIQRRMEKTMNLIMDDDGLWFKKDGILPKHLDFSNELIEVENTDKRSGKRKKEICNFTKTFYYQYVTLSHDCSYDDVVMLFTEYYKYIVLNRDRFKKLFQ